MGGRLGISFVAGFVSVVLPCVLPLVPGYLAALSSVGSSVAASSASERRVRDVVVARERAQRFARRAPPNQHIVGNQPAQATATFHTHDSSVQVNAP